MATKRKVGNLLALAVLSYLTQRPMHPYELGRTLRDNDDARSVKYNLGSLYMVVQQLTKVGFITPLETNREGLRPERTVYALTDAGRHELRDWLRELIAEQRAQIRALIDRTLATGVPELFLVEEDYRLALLEAESSFVQRLIDRITDPATGWGRMWAAAHGEPEPAHDTERQPS